MGHFLKALIALVFLTTPAYASYCPNCGGTGGISAVTGVPPIAVTAGATPVVSIAAATCANDGTHALTNPAGIALVCGIITAGSGTVTSVGLASNFPGVTLSGTPVTTSGTLTETLASQTAHFTLIGPTSGSSLPTWRALVGSDLPNPSSTTLGGVESLGAVTSKWINTISTSGVPSATQPNYTDLAGSPPPDEVITTLTISGNTALSLPASPNHSMQVLTMAANATIQIPVANWAGQHLEIYVCQNGTGNFTPAFSTPGLTFHGTFPTPTLTAGLCDVYGIAYTATNIAFLTGFLQAE